MAHLVHLTEYEFDHGSRILAIKYFKNKSNAISFIEKSNSNIDEHGIVPKYYIVASYEGEVILNNATIKYED